MFFYEIETDRLILKNISEEHRDFIFSEFSDDVINEFLFDAEPLVDKQGADEIIEFYLQPEPRMQHRWILVKKDDHSKIGTCGFHCWNPSSGTCDIGYDLKMSYWGNGYMSEAVSAIMKFAKKEMNILKINACIYSGNMRSIELAQRMGFVFSGKTENLLFRGREYEHKIYTYTY